MKVQQSKNKSGLKGGKWSGLNAPGTYTPLSHPLLESANLNFLIISLWGNKKWSPSMKVQQMENSKNKMGLKG